eukprot:scaffold6768_cov109-Cylindrotheca_fusiformis.AAC.5
MTATTTDDELSIDDSTSHYQSSKSADETRLSNPNTGESRGSSDARETTKMLQRDWKIRMFRYVTIALLVATAIAISVAIYAGLRNTEQREFEHSFEFQASQIEHAMGAELEAKLRALDSMSVAATSYSRKAITPNDTWPYITLPHFPNLAAAALNIGRGLSVTLVPIIHRESMVEWQDYSVRAQGWTTRSREFQIAHPNAFITGGSAVFKQEINDNRNISEFIFEVVDGIPTKVKERDFMLPIWQIGPLPTGLPMVNYDLGARESTASAARELMETQSCVLGDLIELSASLLGHGLSPIEEEYPHMEWPDIWDAQAPDEGPSKDAHRRLLNDTRGRGSDFGPTDDLASHQIRNKYIGFQGPASIIQYPVFSPESQNRSVVAILSMITKWDSFILPNMPPDPDGLIVVISNSCQKEFTFALTDIDLVLLGDGDLHEAEYESLKREFYFAPKGSPISGITMSQNFCPYKVTVYPSTKMRGKYESDEPAVFAGGVAGIFLFTLVVFLIYDVLVESRQRFLADTASKSNAIVSALFPQIVRDRMFETEEKNTKQRGMKSSAVESSMDSVGFHGAKGAAPIANLFTNATVMFGDISGFTAWSSSREPVDVFTLLETLYSAFDKIARDMDVFKVETIGDCYVAVTGLPNPQDDHHLRMVRFARRVLDKMIVRTKEMETTLGPDTGNLGFRTGIHSGPVTGGVLRGEKSRYQLFGDTVNMASRMETTGHRNQIQVSQSTAGLILASGKGHWLRKREGLVQVKGKGAVQTFWVKSKSSSTERSDSDPLCSSRALFDDSVGSEVDRKAPETASEKAKGNSLIAWQVELLTRLLKRIVLHRQLNIGRKDKDLATLDASKILPRDQVTEIIPMPGFDPKVEKHSMDADSVELPSEVVSQLNDLVATIASMYNDNSFHNFEHACHVTMSANKLLNRIVVPSPLETNGNMKEAHDFTYGLTSDPLTQFAIIFSAIVHDVDHQGVSNEQLVNENNRLASMYKCKSILEQNSIDLAFELFSSGNFPALLSCVCTNESEVNRFRQLVVNSVIATDM